MKLFIRLGLDSDNIRYHWLVFNCVQKYQVVMLRTPFKSSSLFLTLLSWHSPLVTCHITQPSPGHFVKSWISHKLYWKSWPFQHLYPKLCFNLSSFSRTKNKHMKICCFGCSIEVGYFEYPRRWQGHWSLPLMRMGFKLASLAAAHVLSTSCSQHQQSSPQLFPQSVIPTPAAALQHCTASNRPTLSATQCWTADQC